MVSPVHLSSAFTFVHLEARLLLQVKRRVCPPIVTGVHHAVARMRGKYLESV
jgi:hypothetical protein